MRKYILFILFALSAITPIVARHIVGGELIYDCLGNNNYRFTLKLYRNCNCTGSQCAPFDSVAFIRILDASGNLVKFVGMNLPPQDTVTPNVENPCLEPQSVCIEQAFYTAIDSLPPIAGGYTLQYQRCCRNSDITSILIDQGATYQAHIPGIANACNNSPRFRKTAPLFFCAGSYFNFDNSATDPDGDSISYALVDPLDGATSTNPAPFNNNSQYTNPNPIVYNSPYNAQNPTNDPSTADNLRIDSTTGLLTGIPNQTGSFIVAVAAYEWRNGVLIGQTVRDYQFNIVPCNIPTANIIYKPGSFITSKGYGTYEINCANRTVNFNRASFNNPPPTNIPLQFHWDFGVAGISSDTSNLQAPIYTYPDTGTYRARVVIEKSKTINGVTQSCYDTSYALIVIYPLLKANFSFINVCQDSVLRFIDSSTSTYDPVTVWNWNFGDGSAASPAVNASHQYATAGRFPVHLTITTKKGCVENKTDTVTVKALPKPNFTTTAPCVFDSIQFQYSGTGTVGDLFWDFNNGGSSTMLNPSTIYTTLGVKSVSLIAVTSEGCRDTATKLVTINPLPVIVKSPDVSICFRATTQLSASGGTSYVWSPDSSLSSGTISNPIASPINTTSYHVTVTDGNGCKQNDSILVSVFAPAPLDAGRDTSVCFAAGSFRDSVQLLATGSLSYIWTPATGLTSTTVANPISRPRVNTTYYVTGTDVNGCKLTDSLTVYVLDPLLNLILDTTKAICDFDTTTLQVIKQGNSQYIWSPTTGISDPFSNSPRFFPHVTTQYRFTIQNYCYIKSDTVTVLVHPLPTITTQKLDSVCIGDSVRLRASGSLTYTWRADSTLSDTSIASPIAFPHITRQYVVTGTDNFGCRNKDSVVVRVYPLPVTSVFPDTAFICQGKPLRLIATGGVDYLWQANSSLSATNIATPIATPLDTTKYYVRVFNIHQCHSDDSITVNVQVPVKAIAPSGYDVCERTYIRLHASGGFYYHWSPDTFLSNPNDSNPLVQPTHSIRYIVRVSNDCFSDSTPVDIIIRQLPIVNAGLDTTIYRNTSALLMGTSNATTNYWFPPAQVENPNSLVTPTTPLVTTQYYLYAISDYRCTNVDSVIVTIDPRTIVLLPTGFSPNGDGVNDVFRIAKALNIKTLVSFAVYNRWGERVFETNDINEGWDGVYRGQLQEVSTYVWYVNAKTYEGEDLVRSGNVTLVR